MKETSRLQCIICGEEAMYSYSPDLDVRGLGACETHRTEVKTAYEILMFCGENDYDKFLISCRKKHQKAKTVDQ